LIEVNDLTCTVADEILFDRLALTVASGDALELWGPNGSGKSTLLRCLAGLFEADAGVIKSSVGLLYMGHRSGLNRLLSPLENLRWYAGMQERDVDPETQLSAIRYVGLDRYKNEPCHTLSVGQMRRAALARLVISKSRLWLLDEPLTSLDVDGAALLRNLIEKLRRNGGGCICATHVKLELPQSRVLELSV